MNTQTVNWKRRLSAVLLLVALAGCVAWLVSEPKIEPFVALLTIICSLWADGR